jgi:hypothetical protein
MIIRQRRVDPNTFEVEDRHTDHPVLRVNWGCAGCGMIRHEFTKCKECRETRHVQHVLVAGENETLVTVVYDLKFQWQVDEISAWAREHGCEFGAITSVHSAYLARFANEDDKFAFKMRWG